MTLESVSEREAAMREMSFTLSPASVSKVSVGSSSTTLRMSSALPSEMPYCWARALSSSLWLTVWLITEACRPSLLSAPLTRAVTRSCNVAARAASPFSTVTRMEFVMSSI